MIPILYREDETLFSNNGIGRLADCISCKVTEERNGIYECCFTYPVTGDMYDEIQEGRIIGVIHDDTKDIQPFDIYSHSAPLDGVVTFYAHHISYRLGNVILKPMTASSCSQALAEIPNNTYNSCPFTFWTNKATSAQWTVSVPSAVKAVLGGQEGSILDVYGKGEYKWDKWTVRLYTDRGNDNGVSIRYGVNLTDLTQDYDESGSYNAVAPYWVSYEDGSVVSLDEGIVLSSAIGTKLVPWTTHTGEEMENGQGTVIEFQTAENVTPVPMDLSSDFDEKPTKAQLRAKALSKLESSEAWLPSENIKVKFVNLADTEEYKNVSALQRVSLCDKVSVYCGPLGVSAVKMQVIRVVYNVLTERYDEMELGKPKTSFAAAIKAEIANIVPTTAEVSSMLESAVGTATEMITGALGGYVRFIYDANGKMQEIVIMDTESIETAVKVWRWNSGGLGFSSNGYAGPYTTAITQNGAIVADFITTGSMYADRISGGTLTLGGADNVNGQIVVKNASNVTVGTWSKDGITVGAGSISGASMILGGSNNANGTLTVKDASGNTIGTWDNNGISVSSGSISGSDIVVGGNNNANGTLTVKNSSGTTIGTWNKDGITVQSGSIYGVTLTLGGSNNTFGTLTIKNASGYTVGTWNMDGITVSSGSINGASLTLGGSNNSSGTLTVKNSSGTTIGTWNNSGISVLSGSISGASMTLGGNNNNFGTLTIQNASGYTIGTWNKDGISVSSGSINGASLTLGGNNNTSGSLTVNNSSGTRIGLWNKDGLKIYNSSDQNNPVCVLDENGLNVTQGTINGSSISLGGSGNQDGYLTIYDDSGYYGYSHTIGSWDSTGIMAKSGTFGPWTLDSSGFIGSNTRLGQITSSIFGIQAESDNGLVSTCIRITAEDIRCWYNSEQYGSIYPAISSDGQKCLTITGPSGSVQIDSYVDSSLVSRTRLYCDVYQVRAKTELYCKNLTASGTKNRVVETEQYSDRLLYCYETSSPMFGDVGEGQIGADGKSYIWLDPIFAQTITTDNYQVFLQKYGRGDCWVAERHPAYFVVEGDPDLSFGWELKAKQCDYDQTRLEQYEHDYVAQSQSYGEDAGEYIKNLMKERIAV